MLNFPTWIESDDSWILRFVGRWISIRSAWFQQYSKLLNFDTWISHSDSAKDIAFFRSNHGMRIQERFQCRSIQFCCDQTVAVTFTVTQMKFQQRKYLNLIFELDMLRCYIIMMIDIYKYIMIHINICLKKEQGFIFTVLYRAFYVMISVISALQRSCPRIIAYEFWLWVPEIHCL